MDGLTRYDPKRAYSNQKGERFRSQGKVDPGACRTSIFTAEKFDDFSAVPWIFTQQRRILIQPGLMRSYSAITDGLVEIMSTQMLVFFVFPQRYL